MKRFALLVLVVMTVLGWCPDVCCYHLYSETLGTSAYVPLDQLPYTLE